MMLALDEQILEFASLGEVFDPSASEQSIAAELAETLMRQPLVGGPLARIAGLTKLLRILKSVLKIVTAERDLAAYSAAAVWPYRRLAALVGVHTSTMQSWINGGRKVLEPQDVPRGAVPVNGVANSNSNGGEMAIKLAIQLVSRETSQ